MIFNLRSRVRFFFFFFFFHNIIYKLSKDNPIGDSERQKEKGAERRKGGKTIHVLKSGQELTLIAQLGELKTGQGGKGLLMPRRPSKA